MKTSIIGAVSTTKAGLQSTQSSKNMPEKKFRAGAVSVTVWKNMGHSDSGAPVEYQTISLERSYKDKSGDWQHTGSLRVNDLPRAGIALQKAYEYLVMRSVVS